jgi:small subunit ribosomal protein S25e
MGGTKKKSLAAMEKEQEAKGDEETGSKSKKGKEQKTAPQQQKRLPFLAPRMSEDEMLKALTPLKAVTVFGASRVLGVNASIATGLLKNLEKEKRIVKVGGFSGHFVWAVASNP